MSSSDSKLLIYAKKEAEEAIAFDNAGKYHQAMNKYQRAAEILIQFLRFNKNPIMRQNIEPRVEEYLNKAKILKARLGGKPIRRGAEIKPSEEGSEAKGATNEEQELLDMISGTIVTESPNVSWNEIAGLENCKQALREAIVLPMVKPDLFTGTVETDAIFTGWLMPYRRRCARPTRRPARSSPRPCRGRSRRKAGSNRGCAR